MKTVSLLSAALLLAPVGAGAQQTSPTIAPNADFRAFETPRTLENRAYVLGPNDEIEITVFGQPDMGLKTRIRADGTIIAPFLGTVAAAGQTTAGLSTHLAARYREGGYLSQPSINVEVTTYASKLVNVSGWVKEGGLYPLDRPYTVAMMVALAGGAREGGANVAILKPADGGADIRIPLAGDGGQRPVGPGDQIYVPEAEKVYVYGEVNDGGAFDFRPGMTFRQALAMAGGPTLAGSTRRIRVTRDGEEVKLSLDDEARPEDVLFIREKLF